MDTPAVIQTDTSGNFQDTRLRLNEAAEYCVGVRCPQTFLSPFHGFSALGFPTRFCIFCLSYSGLLVRLCTFACCPYRHSFSPPSCCYSSFRYSATHGPSFMQIVLRFLSFSGMVCTTPDPGSLPFLPPACITVFSPSPVRIRNLSATNKKSTKLSFSPLHTDNLCAIITFVCLYGVALALHIEPGVPCDSRTTALPAHAYH